MNGGYFMVDGKGLDLTADSTQTISGLFADCKAAIESGKPIYGYNCVWGDNNDSPLSPIGFFAQKWTDELIVMTASTKNVTVTKADVVTVTDLVS